MKQTGFGTELDNYKGDSSSFKKQNELFLNLDIQNAIKKHILKSNTPISERIVMAEYVMKYNPFKIK